MAAFVAAVASAVVPQGTLPQGSTLLDASSDGARTIAIEPVRGAVFLRLPDAKTFVGLTRKRRVPDGTEIDATDGEVRLVVRAGDYGNFYAGRFTIVLPEQPAAAVELRLSGGSFKPCATKRTIAATKPPRRSVRRLWGKANGKFRTRGRYSSTSVRGTAWLTDDRCDGTRTFVREGQTVVFDFVESRTVTLRAGQSYLAKAPIEFPIPSERALPASIVTGSDGRLWFTEPGAGNIGRSTSKGSIIEFAVPPGPGDEQGTPTPEVIAVGPDRNLWFTDEASSSVGRITTAGVVTAFPVGAETQGITLGPDRALWYTQVSESIGRIATDGTVTEFEVPLDVAGDAMRIARGPDGNLWFTEFQGSKIGRLTPEGRLTEFPLPTEDAFPFGITAGPDGAVWFVESGADRIGRITRDGKIWEWPIPTENSSPLEITLGPDRNLWFTEYLAGKIGRITPAGVVTEIPVPTQSGSPTGITAGPNGTVWVTDESSNNLICIGC